MVERLKQEGISPGYLTDHCSCVKMGVSRSAQAFRQEGEMPSGLGAFLVFSLWNTTHTNILFTAPQCWQGVSGRKGRVAGANYCCCKYRMFQSINTCPHKNWCRMLECQSVIQVGGYSFSPNCLNRPEAPVLIRLSTSSQLWPPASLMSVFRFGMSWTRSWSEQAAVVPSGTVPGGTGNLLSLLYFSSWLMFALLEFSRVMSR